MAVTELSEQQIELITAAAPRAQYHLDRLAAGTADAGTPVREDAILEAECAWLGTGLVHQSYSGREIREICAAIVGQVAVVLLMNGWTAPELPKDAPHQ